jgi:uncharacterized protein YbjT (DUF2867 family)
MRFLLLGATGATGRLLTRQALEAGHEIVAFVRDPASITAEPGLTVVAGDVRSADDLAGAMRGTDAVISTLGLGRSTTPNSLIADTARALVAAASAAGVDRIVLLSAFGVGDSLATASWLARQMFRGGRATFADKAEGEAVLAASPLDVTVVYPGLLTNAPATHAVEATALADVTRVPGLPRIPRADVAAFLLAAAQTGDWSRTTVVITTGTRAKELS